MNSTIIGAGILAGLGYWYFSQQSEKPQITTTGGNSAGYKETMPNTVQPTINYFEAPDVSFPSVEQQSTPQPITSSGSTKKQASTEPDKILYTTESGSIAVESPSRQQSLLLKPEEAVSSYDYGYAVNPAKTKKEIKEKPAQPGDVDFVGPLPM